MFRLAFALGLIGTLLVIASLRALLDGERTRDVVEPLAIGVVVLAITVLIVRRYELLGPRPKRGND